MLTLCCCFFYLQVVKIYNESINAVGDSEDCLFYKASQNLHVSYFREALFLIEQILPQGMVLLLSSVSYF
jgi:endoribonuclease Dicer